MLDGGEFLLPNVLRGGVDDSIQHMNVVSWSFVGLTLKKMYLVDSLIKKVEVLITVGFITMSFRMRMTGFRLALKALTREKRSERSSRVDTIHVPPPAQVC